MRKHWIFALSRCLRVDENTHFDRPLTEAVRIHRTKINQYFAKMDLIKVWSHGTADLELCIQSPLEYWSLEYFAHSSKLTMQGIGHA